MLKANGLARVESITAREKLTSLKVSAKGVSKAGNEYTDFKGFVALVGEAHSKAVDLSVGDDIKLLDLGVQTNYKDGKNYTNFYVSDIEIVHNEGTAEDVDEELPFS